MKMMRKVVLGLVCGGIIYSSSMAAEKIVWSPADGIGKTTTWKESEKANAKAQNGFVEIELKGSEWSGMGLNWEGYWPADAGQKASDYSNIAIELEVSGANAQDLQIALKDNTSKDSASVFVKKYSEGGKLPEGRFLVKVPMSDLLNEKSKFETGIVWEIMFHAWTQGEKEIKIKVYRITFE